MPTIKCPNCESKIKCPETIIGRNVNCPKCKNPFLASLQYEPSISHQLEIETKPLRTKNADERFCTECGEIIKSRAEICPKCGVRQLPNNTGNFGDPAPNGKSRITAALLAIFLGGLGIHKFYLGQNGAGIIYLLFCWTLVPLILSVIDFIVLVTMSDDSFDRSYGFFN